MKIIIDSGHGGNDPGAVAFGMQEKKLNLVFAKLLAQKLEKLNIDVDTSLINDKNLNSTQLTDAIVKSNASICISCHNNASNGNGRGFEVIRSIHSQTHLADYISKAVKATGMTVRSITSRASTNPLNVGKDYYYIIRLTYPKVETIIIEFGFMDNLQDFKILNDPKWQDRLTTAVASAVNKYVPAKNVVKTQILGKSILLASQLKEALKQNHIKANTSIVDIYYRIAAIYGIKADLSFIQSMHETNWLKFTGIVKASQNNFAGLGATGGDNHGESFPSVAVGVEAHIQHLFAYCSKHPLPPNRKLYDTRFNYITRGSSPTWEGLDGKWAVPGLGYGENLIKLQKQIFEKYPTNIGNDPLPPPKPPVVPLDPPIPPAEPPLPPTNWAQTCNDELLQSGLLDADHSSTLDKPASEGMLLCLVNKLRKEITKNG